MTAHSVKQKRRVIGCVTTILILIFGLAFGFQIKKFIKNKYFPTPKKETVKVIPNIFEISLTNMVRERTFTAEIHADKEITLSAAVDGEIVGLNVDVGSIVTHDQVLIKIDDRYKKIAVKQSEAAFQLARVSHSNSVIDLSNNKSLFNNDIIGDDEYRKMIVTCKNGEANLQQAEASLEHSREQLSDCKIKAPCNGKVSARFVEIGERVNFNQKLLTIVDDTKLRLVFFAEDRDIIFISNRTKVIFYVDSIYETAFTAIVTAVGADVESETRLFRVEATYDNKNGLLKAGMIAKIIVPIAKIEDAIFIPSYIIKHFKKGNYVTLYENKKMTVSEQCSIFYKDITNILSKTDKDISDIFPELSEQLLTGISSSDSSVTAENILLLFSQFTNKMSNLAKSINNISEKTSEFNLKKKKQTFLSRLFKSNDEKSNDEKTNNIIETYIIKVKLGTEINDWVEVVKGLNPGDKVLIN